MTKILEIFALKNIYIYHQFLFPWLKCHYFTKFKYIFLTYIFYCIPEMFKTKV